MFSSAPLGKVNFLFHLLISWIHLPKIQRILCVNCLTIQGSNPVVSKMGGNNKVEDLGADEDDMKKPRKSQMRKTVDYRFHCVVGSIFS